MLLPFMMTIPDSTSLVKLCRVLLGIVLAALPAVARCQVAPPAPTTLPSPLTLQSAVTIALRQQPQLYIARDQITQASGQKLQAQSQYYPTLTPRYQFQSRRQTFLGVSNSTYSTPTSTSPLPIVTTTTINQTALVQGGGLSVSLNQNLFDGGAREAANSQARRAVDAADFGSLNTRQATILTVTQDYYQILLAQDLVKVAQAQVVRYQQAVELAQAQIAAGTLAAKNVYQAQSDLANAQVTLLQNQNQRQLASAALKNALGVATNAPVDPAPISADDQLPPLPLPGPVLTLDAALTTAYAYRPDLRQQSAIVESQNAALQLARRQAGLTVRGDYALTYQATNDLGARGTDSQISLTGSYPLFDAGNVRGAVRIGLAQRDQARNQLELIRQQIRLDVESAVGTRATNYQEAQLAQAAITAAQVNFDAAVAARREGIGTVLDITIAQATLTQSQNQYVTAIYNFYTADAQLQRALGQNDVGFR
jgi:outer membrane protein